MADKGPKKRVLKQETVKRHSKDVQIVDKKDSHRPRVISRLFGPLAPVFRPVVWLGRKIVPRYFKNSFKELRLVTWPNRKETRQLTTAVLIFATIMGITVSLVDYGLDKVFKKVILKQ